MDAYETHRTEPLRASCTSIDSRKTNSHHVLPASLQLAWLLIRDISSLKLEEQVLLKHLRQDPHLSELYSMVQRFSQMVKQRLAEAFNQWLLDCEKLGIAQPQNFALGLRQDYATIYAALATLWSNGQTVD